MLASFPTDPNYDATLWYANAAVNLVPKILNQVDE